MKSGRSPAMWHTGRVPEYCTCGAELPPDARFCHKCGKPQREEPVIAEEPESPPAPIVEAAPPAAPTTHLNLGLAVRIGLLTAVIWFLLNLVAAQGGPIWLCASGFLGVFFYQRRGGRLSLGGGARMGGISGLTSYVLFGMPFLYFVSRPESAQLIRQELERRGIPAGLRDEMLHALGMPVALAFAMLLMFTLLPVIGGLIGAKLLKKSQ
jgi:hypothetical protein